MQTLEFSDVELRVFRRLTTPIKIQDFLETFPVNIADTCFSPRRVLTERKAHCLEGAMFAAAALWLNGERPLLLDLKSKQHDDDHVVALFYHHGRWGAISKTNHAVLRYRDPIYLSPRELAASYFHEYFLDSGEKTLLSYSAPLDLRRFKKRHWTTSPKDLWYIANALDAVPHTPFADRAAMKALRPADPIERTVGKIVKWKKRRA